MNIYVGNLAYSVTEQDLMQAFSEFGTVQSAKMIMDRDTGRPKGFAFVEMENKSEGIKAISGMNGRSMNEREIVARQGTTEEEDAAALAMERARCDDALRAVEGSGR